MLTHACGAGMWNMRLATEARIELMEPMQAFPFFRAMSIAFLEPLDPAFAVKLDTGALSDKIRPEPAVKPLLMHILTNEVFSVRAPPHPGHWSCNSTVRIPRGTSCPPAAAADRGIAARQLQSAPVSGCAATQAETRSVDTLCSGM